MKYTIQFCSCDQSDRAKQQNCLSIRLATMAPSSQDDIPDDEDEHNDKDSLLSKLFTSCADDPKGSVHRAWGVSLIFLVIYFVLAILESKWYSCSHAYTWAFFVT